MFDPLTPTPPPKKKKSLEVDCGLDVVRSEVRPPAYWPPSLLFNTSFASCFGCYTFTWPLPLKDAMRQPDSSSRLIENWLQRVLLILLVYIRKLTSACTLDSANDDVPYVCPITCESFSFWRSTLPCHWFLLEMFFLHQLSQEWSMRDPVGSLL